MEQQQQYICAPVANTIFVAIYYVSGKKKMLPHNDRVVQCTKVEYHENSHP